MRSWARMGGKTTLMNILFGMQVISETGVLGDIVLAANPFH